MVYKVKNNATTLSIAKGQVEHIDNSNHRGYGNFIIINHGKSVKSRYYYLSDILVKVDDFVKKGETIGTSGSTGFTTVNSIGLEIILNGEKADPSAFLKEDLY